MKTLSILLFEMPVWGTYIIYVVSSILLLIFAKSLLGIVFIPEDNTGLVTKKFVLFGANKNLPEGRIIATLGEAGYQAQMLPPGIHFWYWPWQYSVDKIGFTVIPEGKMGLIESRDGAGLDSGHVTAKTVESNKFQDAVMFLTNLGQKGPQRAYLTPGTYRINTALFKVSTANVTEVEQGKVGIVTIHDGTPLEKGEIAGKIIDNHGNFQDADAFINKGGNRGLQEQVLLSGTWFINPWFAEVKTIEMTEIAVGYVGVVVSFVGTVGVDTSGESFTHGNIVDRGQKGVWKESLDPGRYAINTDIMTISKVPTTNIVLNWATARSESHKLDEKLSTITVRSSDGFTFNMDVSQIINISNKAAAKVIARFGSVQNLVSQVLEPTIGNYFRNSAQASDVIDFLKKRSDRQDEAKKRIQEVLGQYDVVAVDTLIGDIVPPAELMKTLTDRKIAEQEKTTFKTQEEAQVQRKSLEASKASANMQAEVVKAERNVEIAEKTADAKIKTAAGDAKSKTINAEADANVTQVNAKADAEATRVKGMATAEVTKAVGEAEASVLTLKTKAVGEVVYGQMAIAESLSKNKIKLVPDVLITGQNGAGNGMLDALLATEFFKKAQEKQTEVKKTLLVESKGEEKK
jgi:uncharacterized membrane protein YqiK